MKLPQDILENKSGTEQVATESEIFYLVEETKYDGGIFTYLKGAEYPQKGIAPAETLFFLNMAKRIVAEGMRLASKLPVMLGFCLGQIVLPKRHKLSVQGILATYNSILWKVISPYILKPEYMMSFSREVRKFTATFLNEVGIDPLNNDQFSKIFSHFFEYDNAYRYRVQDLLSETTKKRLLENPHREIRNFIELSRHRDVEGVSEKLIAGLKILSLLLRIPRYKRAFDFALGCSAFKNFQYDEIDVYWISMRNDYLYMGEDVETRSKRNAGKKIPAPMPKAEYDEYVGKLQRDNNEVMIMRSLDVLLQSEKWSDIIKSKLEKK